MFGLGKLAHGPDAALHSHRVALSGARVHELMPESHPLSADIGELSQGLHARDLPHRQSMHFRLLLRGKGEPELTHGGHLLQRKHEPVGTAVEDQFVASDEHPEPGSAAEPPKMYARFPLSRIRSARTAAF